MGLFDKFFGHSDDDFPKDLISTGMVVGHDHDVVTIKLGDLPKQSMAFQLDENEDVVNVKMDESKAVKAEYWDGLSVEARNALSSQGFYRKGDSDGGEDVIHITI